MEKQLLEPVFEYRIPISADYSEWSEDLVRQEMESNNKGDLWTSVFRHVMVTKSSPKMLTISTCDREVSKRIGGQSFLLDRRLPELHVSHYSDFNDNYYVTFQDVADPVVAVEVTKWFITNVGGVLAVFNPRATTWSNRASCASSSRPPKCPRRCCSRPRSPSGR